MVVRMVGTSLLALLVYNIAKDLLVLTASLLFLNSLTNGGVDLQALYLTLEPQVWVVIAIVYTLLSIGRVESHLHKYEEKILR